MPRRGVLEPSSAGRELAFESDIPEIDPQFMTVVMGNDALQNYLELGAASFSDKFWYLLPYTLANESPKG